MSIGFNLSKKEGPDVEERLCWGFDVHTRKWLEFLIHMSGNGKKVTNLKKKHIRRKINRHLVGNVMRKDEERHDQSKKKCLSQKNSKKEDNNERGVNGESSQEINVKIKENYECQERNEKNQDACLNGYKQENKTQDHEAFNDKYLCNGIEINLKLQEEAQSIKDSHTNANPTQINPPPKLQNSPEIIQKPAHTSPKNQPPPFPSSPSSPSLHPFSLPPSSPPLKSPSPPKWSGGEEEFLERSLIKALNSQNEKGYDIIGGCKFILGEGDFGNKEEREKREFTKEDIRIARVLKVLMREERVRKEVRIHNKGMGLICKR